MASSQSVERHHIAAYSPTARLNADLFADHAREPVTLDETDLLECIFRATAFEPSDVPTEIFVDILNRSVIEPDQFHRILEAGVSGTVFRKNQDRSLWMTLLRVYKDMARERHIPAEEVTKGYTFFISQGPACFEDRMRMIQDSGVDLQMEYTHWLSQCIMERSFDVAKLLLASGVPKKFAYKQTLLKNPKYRTALLNVMM